MSKGSINDYITKAVQQAIYKYCEDTKTWAAYVLQLPGCWGQGNTVEDARSELIEVIEGWLILALQFDDPIPELGLTIGRADSGIIRSPQLKGSGHLLPPTA